MNEKNNDPGFDLIKKIYKKEETFDKKSNPNTPKKHKDILRKIFIGVLIFLVVFLSSLLGLGVALFSKFMLFETMLTLMPGEKLLGKTNILILGIDQEGYAKRSDTMMVVNIDPSKNKIGIISIPRDLRVNIPARGNDKINHAFAYGGVSLAKSTVEQFLNVKIPFYIAINFPGLKTIIDEIGGVEINVEKRMYYVDHSQNLFVDLKPGLQKLSGKDAVLYLRYRSDGGDLQRIKRQQEFVRSFAKQLTSKQNFMKSPQLILKLFSCLDTNLSTKQIMGLALNMRKIYDYGEIKMTSLPGYDDIINGIYYMEPFPEKIKESVEEFLL
ncbi:hypothetical protein A2230_04395 [candidate division WOR-1 bacterium RIFOXYA2_FULL_36_21]|uniref:Cell envelope-related transcriptional attenuator domain-containing protein n=1 Tax=candidate division WOR-1 bacterium RIFOXYB2_FULL_36_35 TaxID=1802578 RepID=A0A1F4S4H1_UNCSA|nr:MAG: hypothetical protein A2230_04395 [candidate division WOR-1 bacterium RIFOXYA2_FULL_36_21]OGC14633.1 MAG: hypothetical protein A2290_01125 [candidate division WOR-1 bacterium RIFOXYB2_FULL_36_35]OGC19651.1 MAG: hypothetical protein A2282_02850 [candidate division WOR-1 bacterium RIFOXYA12_FULL_36_13]